MKDLVQESHLGKWSPPLTTHHSLLTKRNRFFWLCIFLSIVVVVPELSAQQQPNILWITVEDMSPHLNCYGDSTVATPNINKLARSGVRFTNAYSTYGVCAPSRHTIITGMYPTSTGAMAMRTYKRTAALAQITDPELLNIPVYEATPPTGVKCFSEYFRAAGYYTSNNQKTDYQFRTPVTAWDDSGKGAHWRNRPDKSMPFFAVFNSELTHESGTFQPRSPRVTDLNKIKVPPYYPDIPEVREDMARHFDNVHAMDKWVGTIMEQLKEDGLLDNTIVFFYSDHGDGLPRSKRWVYDSGIKVPLIVVWPDGHGAGTINDELVSFVDLAPTVLSVAGLTVPDYMEGQIFLGRDKAEPRKYIYAFRDRMDPAPETIRAVRDARFKYVRNYRPDLPYIGFIPYRDQAAMMQAIHKRIDAGTLGADQWQFWGKKKPLEELYDTEADPYEIHNLASNMEYVDKLAELRTAHERFVETYGDHGMIPETELIRKLWPPDGIQPVTIDPVIERHGKKITIHCPTEGASVAWKFEGEKRWQLYVRPVTADRSRKVEAMATRIGWKPSNVVYSPGR